MAALRNRPRPGLAEVLDAADTVMAGSSGMTLIQRELIVGDAIGEVPDDAPQVPLARDLAAQQRKVRLKPAATAQTVELDVRTANGRARSVLLHRLRALGVGWGSVEEGRGSSGTFRETWRLVWEPELTIRVIELVGAWHHRAGRGHASAARARRVGRRARRPGCSARHRPARRPARRGATGRRPGRGRRPHTTPTSSSVIDTLGPLARALRYGDVRGTDATALRAVFDGLVVRVLAGVVMACRSLDDDGRGGDGRTTGRRAGGAGAGRPSALAGPSGRRCSTVIAERGDVHGLVQGRATRLLHDGGSWNRATGRRPAVAGTVGRHDAGRRCGVRRGVPRRQRHGVGARQPNCSS